MKELIERLKTHGVGGFHIALSHSEAQQIAAALERFTYPPVVQAVLAWLEYGRPECDWVAVDHDGDVYEYDEKPRLNALGVWVVDGVGFTHLGEFPSRFLSMREDTPKLLFHRTANGWTWAGNPAQQ